MFKLWCERGIISFVLPFGKLSYFSRVKRSLLCSLSLKHSDSSNVCYYLDASLMLPGVSLLYAPHFTG